MATKIASWTIAAVIIVTLGCQFFFHHVPFMPGLRLLLIAGILVGIFAVLTMRNKKPAIAKNVETSYRSLRIDAEPKEIETYMKVNNLETVPYQLTIHPDSSDKPVIWDGRVDFDRNKNQLTYRFGNHFTNSYKNRWNVAKKDYTDSLGIHVAKRA